ncbi:MAG: dihydrolipoamide acetyltransferase family protein [Pirellulales bacterium]
MPSIVMPQLVEHMTDAVVTNWILQDGDQVSIGDEVVEVETDKATTAIESEFEGILRILAKAGDAVAVGAPLAEVRYGGAGSSSANGSGVETPLTAPVGARAHTNAELPSTPSKGRILASPIARRMAAANGVELLALVESASGGKIRKADVEAAMSLGTTGNGAARAEAAAPVTPGAGGSSKEMTRTQQLIARRMSESKATVPDFAVSTHVEMSACVELRKQLRGIVDETDQPLPSYNDIIVKAAALTLRAFPGANASYRGGAIELHDEVNVGIAVASEGTLVVPTIRNADQASLGAIARRSRELATAVRDGSVTAPSLAGGTFTVSNLGMYGVSDFTAVINPPQAGILAVGAIEDRVVPRDGEVVIRPMTTITLCSDHRLIYGADAAQFVVHLKKLLENPLAMAL